MDSICEYILSVVCAAILCAILSGISGEKGSTAPIRKLIYGIFLCFTVISALGQFHLTDILEPLGDIRQEALATSAIGQALYQESLTQVITEQTEAYILDKAQSLDITLTVQVWPDENGKPHRVSLEGIVPEAGREALSEALEAELGIPKEHQIWNES